jgi:hypothetical protein
VLSTTTTNLESDEPCGATNNWPSGAAVVTINGASALVVGHNTGVAVYNPSTLVQTSNLQLPGFGQLFAELVPSVDGNRLYALPQCKALNTATTFELPYAQTTENADTNLVAILDTTGSALAVASTHHRHRRRRHQRPRHRPRLLVPEALHPRPQQHPAHPAGGLHGPAAGGGNQHAVRARQRHPG